MTVERGLRLMAGAFILLSLLWDIGSAPTGICLLRLLG